MRKRILINATALSRDLTGLGVYTHALIQALEAHFQHHKGVTLELYATERLFADLKSLEHYLAQKPSVGFLARLKKPVRKWIQRRQQQALLEHAHFDLCIEPDYLPLVGVHAKKTLGCIHDVPMCDIQAWAVGKTYQKLWHTRLLAQMRAYDEVICFSECVKLDVLKALGLCESRVHKIYHGLREYRTLEVAPLPPHLGAFILVVGAKAKRRNVARLVEAFKLLPIDLQARFKIVLTGAPNNLAKTELATLEHEKFIINLGYVSDALLQTLYAHARILWWGSLAEGFGLPMLEAMQAKLVVLASHVSCMPEILGDAGIYCNPYNAQDIAKQLERALTDETLRATCIAKGVERVKQFSFKKSMRAHIEIIERILRES
ncbi:glycosyltransferase family 4 protein [Helicobacter baculiformis]|uniref:Glycosyltransferase family 4 protein n=1 Tax=Helicobacter baculiformis TaxID=427351 RepID=A0ABV7ZFX2_9HELI|nr:glycosyltransferase family 1 protein [Helicobacter baculiformis]